MLTASVSALRNTTKVSALAVDAQRGVLDRHRLDGVARRADDRAVPRPRPPVGAGARPARRPRRRRLRSSHLPFSFCACCSIFSVAWRIEIGQRVAFAEAAQHVVAARVDDDLGAVPVLLLGEDDVRGDRASLSSRSSRASRSVDELPERRR